jgi:mannose-1-phosphate guanylyltransferase/mannose-6-phosphate isomerase
MQMIDWIDENPLMTTLVPVLLAGGSGTRLWPTSRKSYPKQFVDLTGSGDSFLQSSLKRSQVMPDAAPWIIVTGEDYRFLVAQQANETRIQVGSILLEPVARNTAPAITLSAFEALILHDSPKLLVQTADHYIKDLDAFGKVIRQAFQSAAPFVLFGVKPTHPEIGYGYIECGEPQGNNFLVSSFKEKPDLETAETYLKSGNFLWNSGMFMLDAQTYLDALKTLEPSMYRACEKAYQNASSDLDFKRVDSDAFAVSPSLSIDYAVMIETVQADLEHYTMTPKSQDLIVSIYCHLPETIRRVVHQRAELSLKPGGLFILEAFHHSQLKYQSGGPKTTDLLYDLEALTGDFQSLQILEALDGLCFSMRVLDT